jgi:AcrR family transcriptional regulator
MTESRRGRPRSDTVHAAILDATRTLLIKSGYAALSMDRVANHAGVGKQTVYRRWPSKAPLVAEAIMDSYPGGFELPDTGDIAADLRAWLHTNAKALEAPENSALVRALAAAAADDPHDGEALYRQLTGPQHEAVIQRLQRGVDAGVVRAEVDLEAVADAVIGAILYRVVSRSSTTDETLGHFDGLVDALVVGLSRPPARRRSER